MSINIAGIDKAVLLCALFNNSKAQGMGFHHPQHAQDLTLAEAQDLIQSGQTNFDYLRGRVMKVEIGGDVLDPWCYDRDLGQGAAQRVVDSLR